MEKLSGKDLRLMAAKARLLAVDEVYTAASGHPGGSLSCTDILTALYFNEMNVDPAQPKWSGRDRFVLSKGHCSPALYAVLALRGFFPTEDLKLFRSIKAHLSGHPDMNHVPGVDMSTGSLGQGLSTAVGMAMAAKLRGQSHRCYALCGDGELAEGQIWEAAMAASAYRTGNLVAIVDNNGLQANGRLKDRLDSGSIAAKFLAFGWNVVEIDGHDMEQILTALDSVDPSRGQPTAIIAHTVKGKGLSFAENVASYHNSALTAEAYRQALEELA